jgi:hypothetical protein
VRHGDIPAQRGQRRLVEDLGHEAHLLVHDDVPSVTYGDSRRFLATVLQSVQSVVRQFGDILAGSPYAKDAASVPRRAVVWIKIVR